LAVKAYSRSWVLGVSVASDNNALVDLQRALPRSDSVAAYLTGAVIVSIATLIKFPLDQWAGELLPPYITYYPALVLASLCGGPRVGFATAAVTLLLAWYIWLPVQYSFVIAGARTPMTIGIYIVSAALLAWVVGLARLTLDQVVADEAEQALSARESVHRIKNLIAVVQALAQKIGREVETTEQFRDVLTKRLEALGTAQNVLIRRDWSDVQLHEVINGSLAPFLPNPGLKLTPGPAVVVPARHVNGLCLALYELCTNAMKYGALADGGGPVSLTWRCEHGTCVLEWREARKTAAREEKSGFGSQLIKMALGSDPMAQVNYEFTPAEVFATFRWPTPPA
jgi:two-component sensor histidine kinase